MPNIEQLIDEKVDERSKTQDQRAESISWWLGILGIVIGFFGVVIPIIICGGNYVQLKEIPKT